MYINTCIYISCKGARARVRRYKKAHCTHNMYIHLYIDIYMGFNPSAAETGCMRIAWRPWSPVCPTRLACEPPVGG